MVRHQFAGPAVTWGREALEGLHAVSGGRWILWSDLSDDDPRLATLCQVLGGQPVARCRVEGDEVHLSGGTDRSDTALNVALGDRDVCELVDDYLGRFETAAPLVWVPTQLCVLARGWAADKVVFDPGMFQGSDRGIDPRTLLQALAVIVDEVLRPDPSPTAQALIAHAWRLLWDLRPQLAVAEPCDVEAETFLDVIVLASLAREGMEDSEGYAPIDVWEHLLEEGKELAAARSLAAYLRERMEQPGAFERLERFARSGGFAGPAGFVIAVGECSALLIRWIVEEGREEVMPTAEDFDATTDVGGQLEVETWRRLVAQGA